MKIAVKAEGIKETYRLHQYKAGSLKSKVISFFEKPLDPYFEKFTALDNVSFEILKGETVGIIGSNGSGKSTLLKIISGILKPDEGRILIDGRTSALLELGAGFHPDLTGIENIFLNASILGLSRSEIKQIIDRIIDFAEIRKFIDMPVKTYSSGMYMRLGFSIAVNVNPEILLIDEVLSVGDLQFQKKCFDRIMEIKGQKKTIILVSHHMDMVENLCERVIWLDQGKIKKDGPCRKVMREYQNSIFRPEFLGFDDDLNDNQQVGKGRFGTKEVVIRGVRFLDKDRNEKKCFETGESLIMQMKYYAKIPIEDAVFGFSIFRNDYFYVYGINTKWDSVKTGRIEKEGFIELILDPLLLLPGEYLITADIFRSDATFAYDFHSLAYRFEVTSDKPDHGVAIQPHFWNIVK
ncbi:MAG: ABC transporter ATP-binding protein [Candidatus Coatesbacteria bacterium]|nr:ABC transporter ATP-binding protein [Candidatus Coatesbacteria bacterium]